MAARRAALHEKEQLSLSLPMSEVEEESGLAWVERLEHEFSAMQEEQARESFEELERVYGILCYFLLSSSVHPSSPNTESFNQGPVVFSANLMYHRISGWSATPQGTGTQLASGNNWVIISAVLLSDWMNPTIGSEIKVLPSS